MNMELREKLRWLRKENDISQLEIAEKLGVSRQTISRWEAGTSLPSTENLMRLSALYGVPLDEWVKENWMASRQPEPGLDVEVQDVLNVPIEDTAPKEGSRPKSRWRKWCVSLIVLLLAVGIAIGGILFFRQRNRSVSMDDLEGEVIDFDSLTIVNAPFLPSD